MTYVTCISKHDASLGVHCALGTRCRPTDTMVMSHSRTWLTLVPVYLGRLDCCRIHKLYFQKGFKSFTKVRAPETNQPNSHFDVIENKKLFEMCHCFIYANEFGYIFG